MFGLLNLDKPQGWTSRDAVNRIYRFVRPAKAGHAGTLDPLATGVLVVCIGQATRLIEHVQRMPKTYRATFLLGRRSTSDDVDSEVEIMADAPQPTRAQFDEALPQFVGEILQRPPAFSAVKVDGQRAYKLARRGELDELPPRPVTIYELQILAYDFPRLELLVRCGSGTYVRSVGRDLAAAVGGHAVMSALARTAIGSFGIEQAVDPRTLTDDSMANALIGAEAAVGDLPIWNLDDDGCFEVARGGLLTPPAHVAASAPGADEYAAFDATGKLRAILKRARGDLFKPAPNFLHS